MGLFMNGERVETDVLIIGSEGAGATAAIEASKKEGLRVTIATKGRMGKCGATVTGDADFDVDSRSLHELFPWLEGTDPRDSQEIFFQDIVKGGKYLNNQRMVEIHVKEAPERLRDLVDWGVKIEWVMHSSGHSYPRGVFIPGTRLVPVFKKKVKEGGVEVIEDTMITDLLINDGKVAGAVGLNIRNGNFIVFSAKAVVIATGGCQRIYPITTAPEELTGDGLAMAYRAGVELADMEFPMFLPGGFVWPPALLGVDVPFILSTAGRYGPGHLLNRYGERFLEKWAPKTMEHSTRDICSVAMMTEILEGRGSKHGGVYVSLKHLPDNLIDFIHEWQAPEVLWRYGGFDLDEFIPRDSLKREALEAAPASHFFNGGIRINERCETNIAGLFAAGEVTAGIHGGNRLSGNAFTEMVVWGTRAGRFAAEFAKRAERQKIDEAQVEKLQSNIIQPLDRQEGKRPIELKKKIQELAWKKVGVIRDGPTLNEAIHEIRAIKEKELKELYTQSKDTAWNREWVEALQVENMLQCLEIIATAALAREESRAAHYRKDFPNTDYANWTKNIVVKLVNGKMQLRTEPVVVTKLKPPSKVVPYGIVE
jgi:succinate dehydrogenase/fumarate reductase flavoprotein subunit